MAYLFFETTMATQNAVLSSMYVITKEVTADFWYVVDDLQNLNWVEMLGTRLDFFTAKSFPVIFFNCLVTGEIIN